MSAPCLCLEYAKILACERQLATLMFDSLFGVVVFPQPYYLYPLVAYKKSKLTIMCQSYLLQLLLIFTIRICKLVLMNIADMFHTLRVHEHGGHLRKSSLFSQPTVRSVSHAKYVDQIAFLNIDLAMKEKKKKHNTTIPKSNIKIAERGKIDTPNTQIHDL